MSKTPTASRTVARSSTRVSAAAQAVEVSAKDISSGLVRPESRPADVVAFEESVVQFFIEAADLIGAPKSVAAIYGICFASAEPLGFGEIQERLNLSVGSISQGLRVLREVGALQVSIRPERNEGPEAELSTLSERDLKDVVTGKRSARYEPNLAARKLIAAWLDQKLQKHLDSGRGRLSRILAVMPDKEGEGSAMVRERLEQLQNWHDKAHALLPIVKAFLKVS